MFGLIDKIWGQAPDVTIVSHLAAMASLAQMAAARLKDSNGRDLKTVARLESQSDMLEEKIHVVLDEAFQLRFFEKRDVEHLARELDSVMDGMQSVAKDVEVCGALFPDGLPAACMEIVEIIVTMTETLEHLTKIMESRHMPLEKIRVLAGLLDKSESAADKIRLEFRKKLFTEYYPDGNVIAYQEITRVVAHLEEVTDRANRSGQMILSMARK